MATIDGTKYNRGLHVINGYLVHVIDDYAAVTVGKASDAPVKAVSEQVAPSVPDEPVEALVNVNTASFDELEALDGISPAIAERIIDARPFETVDDLTRVKGIGKSRVDALRESITA